MKPCKVDGCDRRVRRGGLCFGHVRHGEAAAVAPRRSGSARDAEGRKHCRACDEWLPVENFTKDFRSKDGRRSICLTCHASKTRVRKYGVSAEWFDQTFERQGERCAICRSPEPRGKGWAIDHDHKCCPGKGACCGECVRGILCSPCNLALGLMGDDTEALRAAITYLQERKVIANAFTKQG